MQENLQKFAHALTGCGSHELLRMWLWNEINMRLLEPFLLRNLQVATSRT